MRYLSLVAAVIIITTSSCMKNYNCVCEREWHDGNGKVDKETVTDKVPAVSKKAARTACDAGDDNDLNSNGFGVIANCELE